MDDGQSLRLLGPAAQQPGAPAGPPGPARGRGAAAAGGRPAPLSPAQPGRRGGGDGRRHPPPGDRRRGRRLPAPHPHPAARPALLLPRRTQPAAAALQADPVSGQRPEGALPGGPLRADTLGRGGAAVPAGPRVPVGQAQLAAHAGELRVPAAQPAVRAGHRDPVPGTGLGHAAAAGPRSGPRATPCPRRCWRSAPPGWRI